MTERFLIPVGALLGLIVFLYVLFRTLLPRIARERERRLGALDSAPLLVLRAPWFTYKNKGSAATTMSLEITSSRAYDGPSDALSKSRKRGERKENPLLNGAFSRQLLGQARAVLRPFPELLRWCSPATNL